MSGPASPSMPPRSPRRATLVLPGPRRAGHAGWTVRPDRPACLPADPSPAACAGPGPALAQAVFDAMFSDMDDNLREIGVSDLERRQADAGDVGGFPRPGQGLCGGARGGGSGGLEAALARNVWRGAAPEGAAVRWPRWCSRRRPIWPGSRLRPSHRASAISFQRRRHRDDPGTPSTDRRRACRTRGIGRDRGSKRRRMRRPGTTHGPARRARADLWVSSRRDAAGSLLAHGHLVARVVQTCVISLEDFAAAIEERFAVQLRPGGRRERRRRPRGSRRDHLCRRHLDLGEAAAEQLALALDPYPRAPDAVLPDIPDEPEAAVRRARGKRRRH